MNSSDYSDIINKSRPEHKGDDFDLRHPKMSRENRAKIFAPFAALKGHDETINETGRTHVLPENYQSNYEP